MILVLTVIRTSYSCLREFTCEQEFVTYPAKFSEGCFLTQLLSSVQRGRKLESTCKHFFFKLKTYLRCPWSGYGIGEFSTECDDTERVVVAMLHATRSNSSARRPVASKQAQALPAGSVPPLLLRQKVEGLLLLHCLPRLQPIKTWPLLWRALLYTLAAATTTTWKDRCSAHFSKHGSGLWMLFRACFQESISRRTSTGSSPTAALYSTPWLLLRGRWPTPKPCLRGATKLQRLLML